MRGDPGREVTTRGSLTVVGTGIQAGTQTTPEARAAIERADEVLYLVADPVAASWIERLNPQARSLHPLYEVGPTRREAYEAMVGEILATLRRGVDLCVAFYGHPGVFVWPSHEAVARARAEGFEARMLPAVSAEDCLVADLGVDPGGGWQSYEATDFLLRGRVPDTSVPLVLWQIGAIGEPGYSTERATRLDVLAERLLQLYPADHEVVLYEASPYPVADPAIERLEVGALAAASPAPIATLYVPPAQAARADPAMLRRLGLRRLDPLAGQAIASRRGGG